MADTQASELIREAREYAGEMHSQATAAISAAMGRVGDASFGTLIDHTPPIGGLNPYSAGSAPSPPTVSPINPSFPAAPPDPEGIQAITPIRGMVAPKPDLGTPPKLDWSDAPLSLGGFTERSPVVASAFNEPRPPSLVPGVPDDLPSVGEYTKVTVVPPDFTVDRATLTAGDAPVFKGYTPVKFESGAPEIIGITVGRAPTVHTPSFAGSTPTIKSRAMRAAPTLDLPGFSGTAPTSRDRQEPEAPELILPSFTATMPPDLTNAPRGLSLTAATEYGQASASMSANIKGQLDVFLDTMCPGGSEQFAAIVLKLDEYLSPGPEGTGIQPEVEDAIYSRARGKNDAEARRVRDQALNDAATRGFTMPTGAMMSAMQQARQAGADNNARAASEIVVMKAEMEQKNRQFILTTAVGLRTTLLNTAMSYMQNLGVINGQALEYSKAILSAIVETYNLEVKNYSLKLDAYKTEAAVYESLLRATVVKVDVFKAQIDAMVALIQGDKLKVDIFVAGVQAFEAQVRAAMAPVELYKAEVQALQAEVQGDQARGALFGVQAQVYKAQVESSMMPIEAYKAQISGLQAQVQGEKVKGDVFAIEQQVFEVEQKVARAAIEGFQAEVSGFQAEVQNDQVAVSKYAEEVKQYELDIRAAVAPVEVMKAEVAAMGVNVQAGQNIIEWYKAKIGGMSAQVAGYRAQIEVLVAKTSLEKLKVELFQVQVQAYNAEVQAKDAEYRGYIAEIGGETAKAQVYSSRVQAFNAEVQGFKALIESKVTEIQAVSATNTAISQQYTARVGGFKAEVEAEASVTQANISANNQVFAEYRAQLSAIEAQAKAYVAYYQTSTGLQVANLQTTQQRYIAEAELKKSYSMLLSQLSTAQATIAGNLAGAAVAGVNGLAVEYAND